MDTLATTLQGFFPTLEAYKPFVARIKTHLLLVSDDAFRHHVITGMEIVTRIRLNKQKTTTGGGGNVWVEEFLPSDCLFYALALVSPPRSGGGSVDEVLTCLDAVLKRGLLQVGADETVGRGWMRVTGFRKNGGGQ